MKLFTDSSAFAKRYIREAGSEKINDYILHGASELAICVILIPEVISAHNRRVREKILSPEQYRDLKKVDD